MHHQHHHHHHLLLLLLLLLLRLATLAIAAAAPGPRTPRAGADDAGTAWAAEAYDYIVVGAGTAGIIVADRLSEMGASTLLLEQGGPAYGRSGGAERPRWLDGSPLSRVDVPGLYSSIFSTGSDTLLCNARSSAYGGCNIGGTSAINAGLYFQPPSSDWDTFHPAGWHAADVAAAVARLYARQPAVDEPSPDGKRYAQSGHAAARRWLVEGARYAEVDLNREPDRKAGVFGRALFNYQRGQRGGPVTTYLQTALARANFRLQSNVTVARAVRTGATATGVLASVHGQDVTIPLTPTGRVVFSGGAIFSPALLMHSGIGPAGVLASMRQAGALDPALSPDQWIANDAVGAGLFDNPNTFIELSSPEVQSYVYEYESPAAADRDLYLKDNARAGPYAFAGQTSAFWTFINHTDGTAPAGMQGTITTSGSLDYTSGNTVTLNIYGTSGLLSTGRVVVQQDATSGKFIPGPSDGVYYSDAAGRDAEDIAQFVLDIFAALDKTGAGLQPLNIPRTATKEEIKTYITTKSKYAVGQVAHWSSSCRIGTCVDRSTRVIGMDNLHVVDASIVAPLTVNPQFGVMVAAERGAELIKSLRAGSQK